MINRGSGGSRSSTSSDEEELDSRRAPKLQLPRRKEEESRARAFVGDHFAVRFFSANATREEGIRRVGARESRAAEWPSVSLWRGASYVKVESETRSRLWKANVLTDRRLRRRARVIRNAPLERFLFRGERHVRVNSAIGCICRARARHYFITRPRACVRACARFLLSSVSRSTRSRDNETQGAKV